MTTAWTRGIAVGLLAWPLAACEVRVGDDLDGVGGVAGSFGMAGRGGSAGEGGSAGDAGAGGSSGEAGDGGVAGSSGAGQGGVGGAMFPAPTCDPEPADEGDLCVQCLKQSCCSEWLACDDQTCFDEWNDVAECVIAYEFPPGEDEFGMCVSESSTLMDGFVQSNTQSVLDCINVPTPGADGGVDTTRCGTECFGSDIFFFD